MCCRYAVRKIDIFYLVCDCLESYGNIDNYVIFKNVFNYAQQELP